MATVLSLINKLVKSVFIQSYNFFFLLYYRKTTKVLSSILRTNEFEDKEFFVLYFGHLQMKWISKQ